MGVFSFSIFLRLCITNNLIWEYRTSTLERKGEYAYSKGTGLEAVS